MNYLAHLLLAGDHPHNIGGLLGGFAKGNVWQQYPQELALEIMLHRKIDSYTDSHLIVKQAKLRFLPPKSKNSSRHCSCCQSIIRKVGQ